MTPSDGLSHRTALLEHLRTPPSDPPFDPEELRGEPEPVRRYLAAAIAPGTPAWTSASLTMHGHIRVGRWVRFHGTEVLAPHDGFVWKARAGAAIVGSDRYVAGHGAMEWKLLGLIPLIRASGPDVTRSAAGRCGGEAVWLPTSLLPRFGVSWLARSDEHIVATFAVGEVHIELHLDIGETGRITGVSLERWGDPDRSGTFGLHAFGGQVTSYDTFGGLSIPASGRWGWHPGADGWTNGEFFRCQVTALEVA